MAALDRLRKDLCDWFEEWTEYFRVRDAFEGPGNCTGNGDRLLAEIRELALESLIALPEDERKTEAQQVFLSELLGRNLPLPAIRLAACGQQRQRSLNKKLAVCLWLGAFRDRTVGLAGLWSLWLDTRSADLEGADAPSPEALPRAVRMLLQPQGDEGEDQSFITAVLACMNACHMAGRYPHAIKQSPLGDVPPETVINLGRLQRRLFEVDGPQTDSDLGSCLIQDELAAVRSLVRLCLSFPDEAWGGCAPDRDRLEALQKTGKEWRAHEIESFDLLMKCLRSAERGFHGSDTSATIGWVLAVFIDRRAPVEVAVKCADPQNKLEKTVNLYLLRASNTLLDGFLQRVYACIDG